MSKKVADLFCGAGAFTFPLATVAPVLAADGSAPAIAALKAGVGSARGLKPIEAQARDLFRRPLAPYDLRGCDAVVLDPPRAGALEQTGQLPGTKAATVVWRTRSSRPAKRGSPAVPWRRTRVFTKKPISPSSSRRLRPATGVPRERSSCPV